MKQARYKEPLPLAVIEAAMWPPVSGVFSYASCCQYLFRWRSASLRRRIRLAQAAQYLARLDFGWNVAPHSQ